MVRCVGGMTSSAVANGAEASRDGIPEAYRLVRLPTFSLSPTIVDYRERSCWFFARVADLSFFFLSMVQPRCTSAGRRFVLLITWKVLTVTGKKADRDYREVGSRGERGKNGIRWRRVIDSTVSKWITIPVRWRLSLCRDYRYTPIFVAADCKSFWCFALWLLLIV